MIGNTKYVILIHFNDLDWNKNIPRLTKEWISHRMNIFMNFTCKSLKNQTNQDFETFVLYDPLSEKLIMETLALYNPLPDNIHFMPKITGLKAMKQSLRSYDNVCFTKLDSDNMYHKSYIQFLHDYNPKENTLFLAFSKGYAYNAPTGDLATYTAVHEYFYTRIFKPEEYAEKMSVITPIGGKESAKLIPHELISVPMFMIVCHDTNVQNTTRLVHPSRMITDKEEVSKIWKDFTGEPNPYILQS